MRSILLHSSAIALAGLVLANFPLSCSDQPSVPTNEYGGGESTFSGGTGGELPTTGGDGGGGAEGPLTGGTGGDLLIDASLDGTSSSDGRIDPDAECASEEVAGDLKPANMLFVIDKSGSMNCNLPEDGQTTQECEVTPAKEFPELPSKWELTRAALVDALTALQGSSVPVRVGVTVFPTDDWCRVVQGANVPIAELDDAQRGAQIVSDIDAFLDAVVPDGNTPLAGATILAYAHLHDTLLRDASSIDGNLFVVLLTDGYETCAPEYLEPLVNQDVPNAGLIGIRTFVIGVPGSEDARSLLSSIAQVGGTAASPDCLAGNADPTVGDCHFDMTESENFAADLADTLEQISGTALTCELDVPQNTGGRGVDLDQVNVDVNDEPIRPTDCSVDGNSGWQYIDNQTRIQLCGTACDEAMELNSTVKIVLGCPTLPPE